MKMNTSTGYRFVLAAVSLLLTACGGGGYSGDITPSTPPIANATGLDRFLLFPNPQAAPDKPEGPYQTNSLAYARAYYKAIDPNDDKDTLDKWKAANGFEDSNGVKTTAVFGDKRDLGYGRRMSARYDPITKTIAFLVENYVVNPGEAYGYSELSLEAAARQDTRWRIGVNAIEFSPGPNGGASFAKFFNFNSQTGQRELMVDLDFRGTKAMPGPCITCHGGRGDAPKADGTFPLVQNIKSQAAGDVQAHLAPFEVDSLDFLQTLGLTKADQQDELKLMNLMVLCTYPLPSSPPTANELCEGLPGAARRQVQTTENEWEGVSAARLIKAAYAQNGTGPAKYEEPPVPSDWVNAGQTTLYTEAVVPYCRMCHMLRGTREQSDIDFESYGKFSGYADRVRAHVFTRGNMPLAKLVYDDFWASNAPEILATFLGSQSQPDVLRDTATGKIIQPGQRPIADAGPDRVARANVPVPLSASGCLFADTYRWSIVSGAPSATVGNPNAKETTFTATLPGTYKLQLVAARGTLSSDPAPLIIEVVSTLNPAPSEIRFQHIQQALEDRGCTGCHVENGASPTPVFYDKDNVDFNAIRSRINFTDIVASPLLRKPSGSHHGDGLQNGFDATRPAGNTDRQDYDLFLNWILNGALDDNE
jgi:hypothetical protein